MRNEVRWQPHEVELLRTLVGEALTARQIGAELGRSRNSIIGASHRYGARLTASNGGHWPKGKPREHRKPTRKPMLSVVPVSGPVEAPTPLRLNLLDLQPHHCRWPHGDPRAPDFGFCGATKPFGQPYCEYHKRLSEDRSKPVKRSTYRTWRAA